MEADMVSVGNNQFVINWTTNAAMASQIHYLIVTGLTNAKVVNWTAPSVAVGSKTVTGVGFTPDLVFHAGTAQGSLGSGTTAIIGFGMMNKHGQQVSNTVGAQDAVAPNTERAQQTDACFVTSNVGGGLNHQAHFQEMNSDGFKVYFSAIAAGTASQMISLCLGGISSKIGAFSSKGTVGSQTITSRHGFTPRGMLFSGVSNPPTSAPDTHARWYLGATNFSSSRSAAITDKDAGAAADVDAAWYNDRTIAGPIESGADYDAATVSAISNDSFTLNWTASPLTREHLYLILGDSGTDTYPSSVVTSGGGLNGSALTAYSNQKHLVRLSNGVLVALMNNDEAGTSADYGYFFYSQDNGKTWASYGSEIAGFVNGSISSYVSGGTERLVAVWKQAGTGSIGGSGGARTSGEIYVMVGTFNAGRTTLTWDTAVRHASGTNVMNYPDIVVNAEGTGAKAHVFCSYVSGNNWVEYGYFNITSGGVLSFTVTATIGTGAGYGNTTDTFPSADINPVTKDIYVAWSAGATGSGKGIRFQKATYSAGSWTWGTEREIDANHYHAGGATRYVTCLFDGTRVVIAGGSLNDTTGAIDTMLYERDSADTTTLAKQLVDNNSDPDTCLFAGSATYDPDCNVYFFGRNGTTTMVGYRKWTRATNSLSGFVQTDSLSGSENGPYTSALRGYYNGRVEWIYTHGNNAPYSVKYDYLQLHNPEAGLTLPTSGTVANLNDGYTFKWSYYDAEGDVQTGWAFKRIRSTDSGVEYWNSTSAAWQSTEVYNSGATTSVTFASGKWPAGQIYNWTVSVKNANGVSGYPTAFTVTDSNTATGVVTEVGSFAKQTGTGFQDITISTNLTGAASGTWAVMFWSSGLITSSGVWTAHIANMLGFTTGASNSYSVNAFMTDAQTTSDTSRRMAAKCITLADNNSTVYAEADFVSFPSSTSMRINWTVNASGNSTTINYMIISGLTGAKAVTWANPTSAIDKSVTGVGFQPDLVLHASHVVSTVSSSTHSLFGFGAMNKHGQQWANAIVSMDAVNPSNTSRYQQTDAAFVATYQSDVLQAQAHFKSMDADGFTLNFSTPSNDALVASLCLKGVSSKIGAFTKNANASANTQTIPTRQGFTTKGALFSNVSATPTAAPAAIAYWMLGASDMTNNRSAGLSDMDAVSPTVSKSVWYSNKSLMMGVSGPGTYVTGVPTTSTTTTTAIAWDVAGGTVESEYLYLLLGDSGTNTFPNTAGV
jgi:hypothetical protein